MEEDRIIHETAALIQGSFEMSKKPEINEEDLIRALSERIADMLEKEPEQLMSALYRLDVLEEKIHPVMRPDAPEPANIGLARLVVERQKQRVSTKANVKVPPLEGMEGWEW